MTAYVTGRYVGGMTSPLQEPTFLVLTALASGPLHGYGVIQEVAALSEGRVRLRPGTTYAALDRLGEQGLIDLDREEVVDGRLRRYYRLTDAGVHALENEVTRLRQIATAAAGRLRRRQVAPDGPLARLAGSLAPGGRLARLARLAFGVR